MLFLRSVLLSFSILWRMVLMLPAIIIAGVIANIIVVIIMLVLMFIAPPIAFVFAVGTGFSTYSFFPLMTGMRLGFQVKGLKASNSYFGMIMPSIGYGLVAGILNLILLVIVLVLFFATTVSSPSDFEAVVRNGSEAAVMEAFLGKGSMALVCVGLFSVGAILLRAAVLPPLAGASIGRDANGARHTPFFGFGNGLLFMTLLIVFPFVAMSFGGVGLLATVDTLLPDWLNLSAEQEFGEELLATDGYYGVLIFFGVIILGWLWAVSLQSAGAVLLHLRRDEHEQVVKVFEDEQAQEHAAVEAADLWRSRMR